MTKRIATASSPSTANKDIIMQILLFLPLQSLSIFRSVCKSWRDVIDSPHFRKLYNNHANHTVHLQFTYDQKRNLSIKLLDTQKLLKLSFENDNFNNFRTLDLYSPTKFPRHLTKVVGPVFGLFCAYNKTVLGSPIAVVNPFLRQIKILPISPILGSFHSESCHVDITTRHIGMGFEYEYKVVELLSCSKHRRLHAHLYSRRANSWRELGGDGGGGGVLDQDFHIKKPVKSLSKNGYFAHWLAVRKKMGGNEKEDVTVILTLDMKEEVFGFRKIEMPDYGVGGIKVFARDDDMSFLLFVIPDKDSFSDTQMMKIYESRSCEGEGDYTLGWNVVMNDNVEPSFGIPLWRRGCVVLEHYSEKLMEVIFYDCFSKKFVGRIELPESATASCHRYRFVQCKGSLISP